MVDFLDSFTTFFINWKKSLLIDLWMNRGGNNLTTPSIGVRKRILLGGQLRETCTNNFRVVMFFLAWYVLEIKNLSKSIILGNSFL